MINPEPTPDKGSIMIVDDTPANLRLLAQLLQEQGYRPRASPNGRWALDSIEKSPPDLILLDIMMPDMNGYELCRRLKADERTRDIPIIFISALDGTFDKVTAFSLGAVDFITKPFDKAEVLARVHTHLSLRQMQRRLQKKNEALAHQNKELDAFAHTVAHDLKNPLAILTGYANILAEDPTSLTTEDLATIGASIGRAANKAADIIDGLLLLASVRKGAVQPVPMEMSQIIEQVQERMNPLVREYNARITFPARWPPVLGYGPWIEEVWANYLSNGLKYGGRPPWLELGADLQPEDQVRFWVRDNGQGVPPEAQDTLFTEFTRLNQLPVEGHGLGLSIVQRIITKLGGQVGVESSGQPGQGSLFYFTLPAP